MERPPADPSKLLASWADGCSGEITPGRAMADLKTGGLRDVLDHLATGDDPRAPGLLDAWMGWERGQTVPAAVVAALAEGGLTPVLEGLAAQVAEA